MSRPVDLGRGLADYAERALLGVLINDPTRVGALSRHFTDAQFASSKHAATFRALRDLPAPPPTWDGFTAVQRADWVLAHSPDLIETVDHGYLTTLIAAAPPGPGQPEVYSHLVVDAAIRRELSESGVQVSQAAAATPQVAALLAVVDTAFTDILAATQRWEQVIGNRSIRAGLDDPDPLAEARRSRAAPPVLAGPPPADHEIRAAEEQVLGAVMVDPAFAATVLDRLDPVDFADRELAAAWRAATDIHADAATTMRRVDPVLVAWTQPANAPAYGPGAGIERLNRLAAAAATPAAAAERDHAVDLVMRGSLARLSATAATEIRALTGQPALQPPQILDRARTIYGGVQDHAQRLIGTTSPDKTMASAAYLAEAVDSTPSTSRLADLRGQASALLTATLAGTHSSGPATDPAPLEDGHRGTLTGRLDLDSGPDYEMDTDAEPDF